MFEEDQFYYSGNVSYNKFYYHRFWFDYEKNNKSNGKKGLSKQFQKMIKSAFKVNKKNQPVSDLIRNQDFEIQVIDILELDNLIDTDISLSKLESTFLPSDKNLGKLTWSCLKLSFGFKF